MRVFAEMALELLTLLTFQPSGGHDPDDLASAESDSWQTLIHGLSTEEREVLQEVVAAKLAWLRDIKARPEHLNQMLETLEALLRGELR